MFTYKVFSDFITILNKQLGVTILKEEKKVVAFFKKELTSKPPATNRP